MSTQTAQPPSRRTNGMLPVTAAQTQAINQKGKGTGDGGGRKGGNGRSRNDNVKSNDTPKKSLRARKEPEGEKLIVRRLPPGLKESEFISILGPDWELGKGKIDWLSFAPGKISVDPSKPSRPGRAYVRVTQKDLVVPLGDAVRNAVWEDAKNTFNNASLLSPPYVEFSIYKKVPSGRKRQDARQGTIDQDAEFMNFLEQLANPTPPKEIDAAEEEEASKTDAKITTTPLVEYILEKRAQKAKEAANPKASKHSRNDSAGKGKGAKEEDNAGSKRKAKDTKPDRADKQPKEPMKILSKKGPVEQTTEPAKSPTAQNTSNASAEVSKSRRAGIAAAARILQRDLGLSPGSAHRKARQDAAKADNGAKTASDKDSAAETLPSPAESSKPPAGEVPRQEAKEPSETATTSRSQPNRRNRGGRGSDKARPTDSPASASSTPVLPPAKPVILKKKNSHTVVQADTSSSTGTTNPTSQALGAPKSPAIAVSKPLANIVPKSSTPPKKAPAITPGVKRGFVKHANSSQGITERVLKEVLEHFGIITFVEIDKRKGFAHVDFAEHDSLVSAISASPIKVAQGTVQVLERKEKKQNTPSAAASATAPVSGSTEADKPSSQSGSGGGAGGAGGGGGKGRRGRGGGGGGTKRATSSAPETTTSNAG